MRNLLFILMLMASTVMYSQLSSENFDIKVVNGQNNFTKVWDDSGSGAAQDVSIWRPKVPSGYYMLGDVVLSQHVSDGMNELYAIVIKPKKNGVLTRASRGSKVWDDSGSGADKDLAVYKLNCPSGYVALGMIGNNLPSNCACVLNSEAVRGGWDESKNQKDPNSSGAFWTDRGSDADDDVSFWKTSTVGARLAKGQLGLSPNTFFATQHHDKTPQVDRVDPYVLKVRFPLDEVSIFNKLEGKYAPPKPSYTNQGDLKTPSSSTIKYKVPFFLVTNDNRYNSQLEQMEKSPMYIIQRTSKYKVRRESNNQGRETNTLNIGNSSGSSSETNHSKTAGVAVGLAVTAGGKAGVPLVAEGEVSVTASVEVSYNYSWGGSETSYSDVSSGAEIKIQPGCKGAILEVINEYDVFRIENGRESRVEGANFVSARTGSDNYNYYQVDWCPGDATKTTAITNPSSLSWKRRPGNNANLIVSGADKTMMIKDGTKLHEWNYKTNKWMWTGREAKDVAVDKEKTIWSINKDNSVWAFYPATGDKVKTAENGIDVVTGGTKAMMVNKNNDLFEWNFRTKKWMRTGRKATRSAIDQNNTIWSVKPDGSVHTFIPGTGEKKQMPGKGKEIVTGTNGRIFLLGTDNQIYEWNPNQKDWIRYGRTAASISIDKYNRIWTIGNDKNIYSAN